MKKSTLFSALIVLLGCMIAQTTFAQVSGKKPELIMYRHNSSSGGNSPTPIVTGDIIGTIKWNGLTDISAIRTGATIRSITKATSPGSLTANMIFGTNDGTTLNEHMILTESGLVGIGTLTPTFNLDVVGNTHTSGRFHGRIHFDLLSAMNDAPNSYTDEAYFERKLRSTLGVPASVMANNFGGVLSLAPGGGAYDHQLFFGQDGIWNRRETENNGAWGAAWEKLLSSADIKGTPNRIARFLPPDNPSSKLGDSQLFDDGAHVGIGTVTPDAAFLLSISGDTRFIGKAKIDNGLEVGANLKVGGNADVVGNSTVGGTADVSGNSTVGGTSEVTGNTHLKAELDVDGQSNFDQRMKIGTPNYGTGYLLSVGGKVIAEEVRVALKASWPDYVFDVNTPAPDIKAWERYILENKHLPGVPSAQEVATAGGFELGETQRVLLEKIEQLTLIVIEQQKQIDGLRSDLKNEKH